MRPERCARIPSEADEVLGEHVFEFGEDFLAFLEGGLGVGVGDEAVAGFGGDADFETEAAAGFDAEFVDEKGFEDAAGAGFGIGLIVAGAVADVAAEGESAEVGAGIEEGDVGVEDAVDGFAGGEEELAGVDSGLDLLAEFV